MSTRQLATATVARGSAPAVAPSRFGALIPVRRLLARIADDWLPRVLWSTQRTGRLGLSGIALLLAGVILWVSSYLPLSHEVDDLRSQWDASRSEPAKLTRPVMDSGAALLRSLPTRAQMPSLLGVLVKQAAAVHLSIDAGKYESTALKSGGFTSYQVSFPVTGPYPQVRQFIDATLTALPAAALSELSLSRKTIGDGSVEAQIRLTVFTRDAP